MGYISVPSKAKGKEARKMANTIERDTRTGLVTCRVREFPQDMFE